MAVLPVFEDRSKIGTGSEFLRLAAPASDTAAGLGSLGNAFLRLGVEIQDEQERLQAKLEEQAKKDDNLRLENDVLDYKNAVQAAYQKALENAAEDGSGLYEGVNRFALEEANRRIEEKFSHRGPDIDFVRLKYARAVEGVLDTAANAEFQARLQWRARSGENKVADLTATVAGRIGAGHDDVSDIYSEWDRYVQNTLGGGPQAQAIAREWGRRRIQRAHAEAIAGRDPEGWARRFAGAYAGQPTTETRASNPVAAAAIHHANVMGINPEILLGMGWIESRLNANAGKPTTKDGRVLSSAEGPWQIIDSPSTLAAIGITKDEKFDIEKTTAGIARFTARGIEWMKSVGITPTPGKSYMMWNLGEGAAKAILTANPNEPVERVLRRVYGYRKTSDGGDFVSRIISNNPSLYRRGMTVGQAIASVEQKMESAIKATRGYITGENGGSDAAVRAALSEALGYEADLIGPRDAAEIFAKAQQAAGLRAKEAATLGYGEEILAGRVPYVDRYDAETHKAVNAAVANRRTAEGLVQGNPAKHMQARLETEAVGFIPLPIVHAYKEAINSGGEHPGKVASYNALSDIMTNNPAAFDATKGLDEEDKLRVREYRVAVDTIGLSEAEAIRRIEWRRSPEGQKAKDAFRDVLTDELKQLGWSDLKNAFDQAWFSDPQAISDAQRELAVEGFKSAYTYHRQKNYDPETAKQMALDDMRSKWGVTNLFGGFFSTGPSQVFMPYPPEKFYNPGVDGTHNWIMEQARDRVRVHLEETGALKKEVDRLRHMAFGTIDAEDIVNRLEVRLIPRADTAQDVRSGRRPGYDIWFRNLDGRLERLDERFVPDERIERQKWFEEDEQARRSFGLGLDGMSREPNGTIDPWSGQRLRPGANTPLP